MMRSGMGSQLQKIIREGGKGVSLSEAISDALVRQKLKKIAICLAVVIFAISASFTMLLVKVQDILSQKTSDTWRSAFTQFLVTTGLSVFAMIGILTMYLRVNNVPHHMIALRVMLMVVAGVAALVVYYIPFLLLLDLADGKDVKGSSLTPWCYFWGSLYLAIGIVTFFQLCISDDPSEAGIMNDTEHRPKQLPVVSLLHSIRRTAQGVAVLIVAPSIGDRIDGEINRSWLSILSPVYVCYLIGTILTFVSLIALGCPTALEADASCLLKLERAVWTAGLPLIKVLSRFFMLLFVIQLTRWVDLAPYRRKGVVPSEEVSPGEVCLWGFLNVGVLGCVGMTLLTFVAFPDIYASCAKLSEEEVLRDEDDELESTSVFSFRTMTRMPTQSQAPVP